LTASERSCVHAATVAEGRGDLLLKQPPLAGQIYLSGAPTLVIYSDQ
jgi:hypothetical protein